jgi:preprotein translocase subunit YajC
MIAQFAFLALWQQQSGAGIAPLLTMVAAIAIFYFILFVPQQKRQKKWQQMLADLKSGDRVTTTGGIVGIILSIKQGEGNDPGTIILRVAPDNVKLEFARNAIASVTVDDGAKKS